VIAWFARNHVAANLLMLAFVVAGALTLATKQLPLEVFPTLESEIITVTVPYRGATPEEVEESVVTKIEEAIADVEGIERMLATSRESGGTVTLEVDDDFDRRAVLDDIKARVDSISSFPPDAEKPVIWLGENYNEVISVVLSGDLSEHDLRRLGERVRDDIAGLPDVTRAELQGARPYEISIEIDEETLQRYGLTFGAVSEALRNSSLDVPAGTLKTGAGEIVLRTKGRAYTGEEFAQIVVATAPDGSRVTVGDIADVRDGFNENPLVVRFNGERCVMVAVSREGNQNAIAVADTVKRFMEERRAALPDGVHIDYMSDRSTIVKGRLEILVSSGIQSAIFVFVVLALFLRPSLAFWVVAGIPVCFLGAIAAMPFLGVTINVVSLFGFILVLGVVVDDAIVCGENIYTHHRRGAPWGQAAVTGAREVALPVIFGVLTTQLAFVPLLIGEGFQGRWNRDIALVVIPVLAVSLIESKLILPAHLSHRVIDPEGARGPFRLLSRLVDAVQGFTSGALEKFVAKVYQPALDRCLRHRYLAFACFLGGLLVLLGFIFGGHIHFIPFPRVQSERATAQLEMNVGTPFEVTERAVAKIEAVAREMQGEITDPDGTPIIEDIFTTVGGQGLGFSRRGRSEGETHLGEVVFTITAPENRENNITTTEIVNRWRERIGPVVGAKELTFRAEIGRGGDPIDVQLASHDTGDLTEAAPLVQEHLASYPHVFDVKDSRDDARAEIRLRIKPEAEQFGLTMGDLARQVRQAFYGDEVQRVQRGRDEVRVFVRYPEERRRSLATLESMRVRTPDGAEVPFASVAEAIPGKSFPRIERVDRNRVLNVTADIDKESADMGSLTTSIGHFMDDLVRRFPGMTYSFEGEAREQRESAGAQKTGAYIVIFGIYAMLAIPFRSYVQPLIVMSVIPFGLVGAVLGHLYHGLPLTMLSIFGLLALSGVVVNDSLVMIDYINRQRRLGAAALQAASTAGAARFRAILLTSLTTFAGVFPLLRLESTQAQFLIPMAISLGYGVLFATAITLFLVPVNYLILEDIRAALARLYRAEPRPNAEPAQGAPAALVE
jgi:multidrug efflux pump subunit AcrB